MKLSSRIFVIALSAVFCLSAVGQELARSKGDGFVHLHGTVQEGSTTNDVLHFTFKGRLQFAFFTAPPKDPSRKRVSLDFEINKVPVSMPKFGRPEYDEKSNPFIVSFKNAVQHALLASKSGEPVTIVLFRPNLCYANDGTLIKLEGESGQILPDRMIQDLHAPRVP